MFKTSFTRRKIAVAGAAILAVTAAASSAPAARGPVIRAASPAISHGLKPNTSPLGIDCATGTSSPYFCIGAENDSTQNGFTYGVYGLEGYAPSATGGVGVLGYSGNSNVNSAYGVYGVTFAPSGIGVYGAGDGPAPAANATPGSNVSTGVVGDSHAGDGVYGSTEWPNESNIGQIAGVFGIDGADSDALNNGVVGTTINGGYGVLGMASSDSNGAAIGAVGGIGTTEPGVRGISTSNDGVFAQSTSGYGSFSETNTGTAGAYAYSTSTTGMYGASAGGDGVIGSSVYSGTTGGNGVYAGVAGASSEGNAIYGKSTGFVGAYFENDTASYDTVVIDQGTTGASPLFVENSNGGLLKVDSSGDLTIRGTLTTSSTFARTRNPNTDVMSYSAQVAEPTMEDVGSAHLINGSAAVALGSDFRQTIDGSSRYMVFLTPYGDNNGLYVASRTPNGFVVRESRGGHSTMDFDYRIVAKQYGASDGRLPRASMLRKGGFTAEDDKESGGRPTAAALAKIAAGAVKPKESAKEAAFDRSVRDGSAFRYQRYTPRGNKLVENRLR